MTDTVSGATSPEPTDPEELHRRVAQHADTMVCQMLNALNADTKNPEAVLVGAAVALVRMNISIIAAKNAAATPLSAAKPLVRDVTATLFKLVNNAAESLLMSAENSNRRSRFD